MELGLTMDLRVAKLIRDLEYIVRSVPVLSVRRQRPWHAHV